MNGSIRAAWSAAGRGAAAAVAVEASEAGGSCVRGGTPGAASCCAVEGGKRIEQVACTLSIEGPRTELPPPMK